MTLFQLDAAHGCAHAKQRVFVFTRECYTVRGKVEQTAASSSLPRTLGLASACRHLSARARGSSPKTQESLRPFRSEASCPRLYRECSPARDLDAVARSVYNSRLKIGSSQPLDPPPHLAAAW